MLILIRGNWEGDRKGSLYERGKRAFLSAILPERRLLDSRRTRILKGSSSEGYPALSSWLSGSKEGRNTLYKVWKQEV